MGQLQEQAPFAAEPAARASVPKSVWSNGLRNTEGVPVVAPHVVDVERLSAGEMAQYRIRGCESLAFDEWRRLRRVHYR
jgi:hypothetical protein